MIKKLFLAFFLTLPLLASAQLGAGQWKTHPYFVGGNAKNCIDAGNKVYYLAGGSLYSFDKEAQTNDVLDANNSLNDLNVRQIYYNYSKQYLVVAYNDCNIDIILSSGEVINVPAVKEVVLHNTKTINDVTFGNGKIYVATSFGYIVLDDESFDVKEVRVYELNVASVAEVGQYKIMSLGGKFYYCGVNDQVEAARLYKQVANAKGDGLIFPINDNKFFLSCNATFQIMTIGHGTDSLGIDTLNFTPKQVVAAKPVTVQPYSGGFVASFAPQNYYYTIVPDGSTYTKVTGNEIHSSQEEGNWWVLGTKGLAHVVGGVTGQYVTPNGISISANAYYSTYDPYQQRVILNRTTDNFVLPTANSGAKTEINSYDGSQWHNITPANAPNATGNTKIVVSPNEPNTYFYCTRTTGGVCKVKNDIVEVVYKGTNSPYFTRVSLAFDSKGNLWMPQAYNTSLVMAITPENQLLTAVDSSKFVVIDPGYNWGNAFKRQVFGIGADDIKMFSSGEWNAPIMFWTNNDDLSLKQTKLYNSFNDQDNKNFAPWGWVDIKADNDGMVWIGTVSGVISLDPRDAFNDDFRVNRITYTKNEGVDIQGVLCEGLQVNNIDVDANNNKWIATNASGVFFVSPDGSEVYKHFDTTNSPLPSDQVYSVCCNRATNSVIIVTPQGVVEYYCDVTPSANDYSNVYAYPNPVEPNFTGLITIKGLMANSNVVITDDEGNIVKTLVSDGGIALWNGCDDSGVRMSTGIYNVYASQGDTSTTGEPLTKIAIIK